MPLLCPRIPCDFIAPTPVKIPPLIQANHRQQVFSVATVILSTLLLYIRVLGADFNPLDDGMYVLENRLITGPTWTSLRELWSPERALAGQFDEYFPLRDTVYWLVSRGFGISPWHFHAANISAHALCSLLVLRFLRTWGLGWAAATFGALIFSAHPVHTESVSWVSGLKDPLYSVFVVMAIDSHIRWLRSRSPGWLALSLAALIASLLTKSIGIATFPVIFLFNLWEKERPLQSALHTLPYAIVTVGFLFIYLDVAAANDIIRETNDLATRLSIVSWNALWYVSLTIFPYDLVIYHTMIPFDGLDWRHITMTLFWLTAIALILVAVRRYRAFVLWAMFFALFLVPVIGFISIPVYYADRYLYLPILAPAALLGQVWSQRPRWRGVLLAVLVLLAVRTMARNEQWLSSVDLLEEATRQAGGDMPELYSLLAAAYAREGDPAHAVALYKHALALDARSPLRTSAVERRVQERWLVGVWAGLATVQTAVGDRAAALVAAKEATRLAPTSTRFWVKRANLEASLGQQPAAIASVSKALLLDPLQPAALYTRALSRFELGDIELGRKDLAQGLALNPTLICPLALRYVDKAAAVVVDQMRDVVTAGCHAPTLKP